MLHHLHVVVAAVLRKEGIGNPDTVAALLDYSLVALTLDTVTPSDSFSDRSCFLWAGRGCFDILPNKLAN